MINEIRKYLKKQLNKSIRDGNWQDVKSIHNAIEALDENYTSYPIYYIAPKENDLYIFQ